MAVNTKTSLKKRASDLANINKQMEILNGEPFSNGELPLFAKKIKETTEFFPLRPQKLEIIQVNVGYMCNQVCAHCHVDAGPDRKEIMTRETMDKIVNVIKTTGAHTLDLTGGAPEMNPDFRYFVEQASAAGIVEAYNPAAVENVMCTNTISISWDGWLYDCDFNQMLDLKIDNKIQHIDDYNEDLINDRKIQISQHCYGCTAGAD